MVRSTRGRCVRSSLVVVAVFALCACGAETDQDPTPSIGRYTQPIFDGSWTTPEYRWDQSGVHGTENVMDPEETHVCILTRVKGDFSGYGEKVYLTVAPRGTPPIHRWILRGESQRSGVGGSARCFKKKGFSADGPERWNSPEFVARTDGSCGTRTVNAWGGNSATFISGMSGKMEGPGESVRVLLSSSLTSPSLVRAEGCQGAMEIKARSFFAGPIGTPFVADYAAPTYAVHAISSCTTSDREEVTMTDAGATMCHFVSVSGDFGGGAEVAEIYELNGRWVLKATAGPRESNSDVCGRRIYAQARCYLRDQTT